MPTIITRGAASAQALGFGSSSATANYVEDVFSTYLYTGNGTTQPLTNGIDLSTKGGMVWIKNRGFASGHFLFDTTRGVLNEINTNTTDIEASLAASLTSFNTTGFTLGGAVGINTNGSTYASWTFRKQAKFFEVVSVVHTTGAASTVNLSSLGTVGFVAIKNTTGSVASWVCWNQASPTRNPAFNSTAAGSATLTLTVSGTTATLASTLPSATYIVYAWAHNAGGFGLDGTQSVVTTGTFTATTGTVVNLGWEPQFLLFKAYANSSNWWMIDNMRGLYASANNANLIANSTAVEASAAQAYVTSTGFVNQISDAGIPYTYVAIRRGPMKVPTDATTVFAPLVNNGSGPNTVMTTSFPIDLQLANIRATNAMNTGAMDRLRGVSTVPSNSTVFTPYLLTTSTVAEATDQTVTNNWGNTGFTIPYGVYANSNAVFYNFRRAPGFFDEVCYTGTGANTTQAHNLAAVPELMIVKGRSGATAWQVYSSALANTEYLVLNTTAAKATGATRWNSTTPTSSVFSIGAATEVNTSAATYVAYLFATCPGVSKVGSYTGNGTTQTIDCGFGAGGARFVLIRRTDAIAEWYVYDTARGMTVLTDPYFLLNTTAAEVATLGSVTTVSTGFALNSTILAAINVNAGTYIFLAIA